MSCPKEQWPYRYAEPRPSLLWAIWFIGAAMSMLSAKGHVWWLTGEIGQWLTIGSSAWLWARWWHLREEPSELKAEYDGK